MTSNQGGFGFGWNNPNQQTNQNQPSGWGSTTQSARPNPFGGTFQGSNQGQSTNQPAFGQSGQSNTNPFGSHPSVGAGNPFQQSSAFGQQSTAGGFGQQQNTQQQQQPSGFGFGAKPNIGQGFGQTQPTQSGGFGFGSTLNKPPQSSSFSQPNTVTPRQSGGFGSVQQPFGSTQTTSQSTGGFGFGQSQSTTSGFGQAQKPAFGFGSAQQGGAPAATNAFGAQFGAKPAQQSAGFGFGTNAQTTAQTSTGFGFGSNTSQQQQPTNAFGQQGSTGFGFGAKPATQNPFGQPAGQQGTTSTFGGFGSAAPTQQAAQSNPFGAQAQKPGGLFGASTTTTNAFGSSTTGQQPSGFQFGAQNPSQTAGNAFQQQSSTSTPFSFGSQASTAAAAPAGQTSTTGGFSFGGSAQATQSAAAPGQPANAFSFGEPAGFGAPAATSTTTQPGGFGASATTGGLFGSAAASQGTTLGQSKPFSFGSTGQATTAATTAPFGSLQGKTEPAAAASTGGLFGSTASSTASQAGQAKPATPFSFGGTQTSTGQSGFGTSTGQSGFGAATQPSTTTTAGGLFGAAPASGTTPAVTTPTTATPGTSTGFGIPSTGTSTTATTTSAAQRTTSNLFHLDASVDIAAQQHTLRAGFTFVPKEEFERLHPLMQQLIQLDNRTQPNHPEYRARGFLLEKCGADKSKRIAASLKQPDAEVEDVVQPDSIRSAWHTAAKRAETAEKHYCPVPCVSIFSLNKRLLDQKAQMEAHMSALQSTIRTIAETKRTDQLHRQWIEEHCEEAFGRIYKASFGVLKQLMMLKERDAELTPREERLLALTKDVRALLRGDTESAAMKKFVCNPALFALLCGKGSISAVMDRIGAEIDRVRHKTQVGGEKNAGPVDETMLEGIIESLEGVRDGTKSLLAVMDDAVNANEASARAKKE